MSAEYREELKLAKGRVFISGPVPNKEDLPVDDPLGTVRLVTSEGVEYYCATFTAQPALQWVPRSQINLPVGAYQPYNANLNALGALTTTSTGRSLLQIADGAAGRTILGLGSASTFDSSNFILTTAIGSTVQAHNTRLDTIAGQANTSYGLGFLTLADYQTARTKLQLGTAANYSTSQFLQTGNDLSDLANPSSARTNLGLGGAATRGDTFYLRTSSNLFDIPDKAAARANLGLGQIAGAGDMLNADNLQYLTNKPQALTNIGAQGSSTVLSNFSNNTGTNDLTGVILALETAYTPDGLTIYGAAPSGDVTAKFHSDGKVTFGQSIAPLTGAKYGFNGTVEVSAITGAGSGLTGLNASNLASGTVPTARLSASLAALADNTTSTVPAGNVTLGLKALTIDGNGANGFTISAATGPFTAGSNELLFSTASTNGVVRFKNTDLTGYPAWVTETPDEALQLAGGLGNSSSVWPFAGRAFLEAASIPGIGGADALPAPSFRILTTQNGPVPSGYRGGFKPRIDLLSDGTTILAYRDAGIGAGAPDDGTAHDSDHNSLLSVLPVGATGSPTIQFGSSFWTGVSYALDSNITLKFTSYTDNSFSFIIRNDDDSNEYHTVNEHLFYGGGVISGQAIGLRVGNYGAKTAFDFESTDSSKGLILKSPNGNRWRVQVSDIGVLTATGI